MKGEAWNFTLTSATGTASIPSSRIFAMVTLPTLLFTFATLSPGLNRDKKTVWPELAVAPASLPPLTPTVRVFATRPDAINLSMKYPVCCGFSCSLRAKSGPEMPWAPALARGAWVGGWVGG